MEFTSILKTVAPWIATAATGPLGGLAIEAATKALGVSEKTAEGLKNALAGASAEDMLALKKADQEFQVTMKGLGYKNVADLEGIAAGDRKSARDMQVANKSIVPALLTWFVIGSFIGTLLALFLVEVPGTNRDIVVYMVGQLSGFAAAAVAFWLGTTRASEDKTHMLSKAQPIPQ